MNRDQKAAVVDEIAEQIKAAEAIFAIDYRGISVAQVAELRAKLRGADARFRIVKNSLSERAADKAGAEALKPMLVGPTALTLVQGDAALAAKALNDTARALNILEFKGGVLNGNALSADDVRAIARLPSREVLHAQLVGTIAAPLTGLVRTLNALIQGLAIQLQAMADQGLVTGTAPPAVEVPAAVDSEAASSSETATQVSEPEAPPESSAPEAEAAAPAPPDSAESQEAAAEPEPEAAAEPEPEAEPGAAEELSAIAEAEPAAEEPEQPEEPAEEAASDAAPSDE
jgi:large subunit ribosomal protein L10